VSVSEPAAGTERRCAIAAGPATAVVGPGIVALVDVSPDHGIAELESLFEVLEVGAGRDLVVRWLSHLAGVVLPSFAIAIDEGERLRILQRGSVLAIATDRAGGHQHVGMEPAIAWHEVTLESPARLFLHLVTGADPQGATVPLDHGRAGAQTVDRFEVEVPAEAPPAPGASPGASAPIEDATVARADLEALLGDGRGAASPLVPAVLCPTMHPNPPGTERCRSCGLAVTDATVTEVVRPSLGRLRLEDGSAVPLAGPVLLGRNPVDGAPVDGVPAVAVRLPDPDRLLSRTHVEVRLDGWDVLVVDRGSVNGTVVHRSDGTVLELVAPVPAVVATGDRVVLGGSTSFVLEADARQERAGTSR